MVVLALETVTRAGSLALLDGGVCHVRTGPEHPTHGERLPQDALAWLSTHGRTLADVDRLAVVCGPGSFTGMRVGIAAIQGLALATGTPVAGIPTLEALTRAWWEGAADHETLVVACLDGQRGDVFAQVVDARRARAAGDCRVLVEPRVSTPAELADVVAGLGEGPCTFAGDGAAKYATVFTQALPGATIVQPAMPLAEAAARIVAEQPDRAGAPHALRPVYLRRPDAVLARERAAARRPAEPGFTIRRADLRDDLTAVETLQRQTFTNAWGLEAIRWELENTDVARLYVMHAPDGSLVAYCACWVVFDELHINSLAVDVRHRRQGLARDLLNFVLDDAVRAGATSATLEVRSSNAAARRLYESLGFKVEGVRRDYYQEPREDAVILWTRDLHQRRTAGTAGLGR